jgi:hypothetical protein
MQEVIPMNNHDLLVTTEDESASMESGATDASRLRDSSVLDHYRQTRPGTDEPSAHPWHQISIGPFVMDAHFQVRVLDLKYPGRIYGWGGFEGRYISPQNYGAAWRSSCRCPRRSHGVPAEAEDFHGLLCPKRGM